jgi:GNAT superfamily N-acetyltransferase
MSSQEYFIREAKPAEFQEIGNLMIDVFSSLKGFPDKIEMPEYYKRLQNIGNITKDPNTSLLIAVTKDERIGGAVVYIGDMQYYHSGGIAPKEKNASGFRLLVVDPTIRGKGIGGILAHACIQKGKEENKKQIIIHTTKVMQTAWEMYEKMGFRRSDDLDFSLGDLEILGFRLVLQE